MTIAEAQSYLDDFLDTDAWDKATDDKRTKALAQATFIIERLPYVGKPYEEDQTTIWPRYIYNHDTREWEKVEEPDDVKRALALIAAFLLKDDGASLEDHLHIQEQTYGDMKIALDKDAIAPHKIYGIPSYEAYRFLRPWLKDFNTITLSRSC